MPLTDIAVRQAKPTGKNYTLRDTAGLALFIGAKGAKQWHFRFYWLGKQARISLGVYPAVSLKEVREARDQARALVAQGIDPRSPGLRRNHRGECDAHRQVHWQPCWLARPCRPARHRS